MFKVSESIQVPFSAVRTNVFTVFAKPEKIGEVDCGSFTLPSPAMRSQVHSEAPKTEIGNSIGISLAQIDVSGPAFTFGC